MSNPINSSATFIKVFLVLSIFLNIILGYRYFKIKYRYQPDVKFNRAELFEHLEIDSSAIVFIGDSMTEQFELTELFKNVNIRNRGINGEYTFGIADRLTNIIRASPKKIFLEVGINDIIFGFENEKILENYKNILDRLSKGSKASKIYVQSVLPVYQNGRFIKTLKISNNVIRAFNKSLQDYCGAHDITYINLYEKFELNGEMNPKYCIADGLHISGDGYLLWTKLLEPYVNE